MLQRWISKEWRQRLAYTGMSLLVGWHTLAMVVATAPDSDITDAGTAIFYPYLTLLRLDNQWGFFAPNVGNGVQFRYVVEDAAGQSHTFTPADKLSKFHPTSIWMRDRYVAVMEYPDTYAGPAAASLCLEHAALKPVSVTLLQIEQKDYFPANRLSGKQHLDPEFIDVKPIKTVPCSAQ